MPKTTKPASDSEVKPRGRAARTTRPAVPQPSEPGSRDWLITPLEVERILEADQEE